MTIYEVAPADFDDNFAYLVAEKAQAVARPPSALVVRPGSMLARSVCDREARKW